jgi:aminoglycoside 6'-N-acetyltransferase
MGTIAAEGDLSIRAMRDEPAEYELISRWRSAPHVHEWWDPDEPPLTPEGAAAQYGARARGEEPTTACIVELDGLPIGYLQFYRWLAWPGANDELDIEADPDTYGIDLFIGDQALIGRGIGTRLVQLVCRHLESERDASWIALTTEVDNVRAQRAYEKAGFRKVRRVLDTDTRDGERVWCWLMERRGPWPEALDGVAPQP